MIDHQYDFYNHPLTKACYIFIIMGIIVRTSDYLFADISFWNDEAALALNICHRTFCDFFKPLDVSQVAPIGFLILEKISVILLGNNEIAFRLIPFISGLLAIGLSFLWLRKAIGWLPALLCSAQLAVIKEPIYYANNLKPYASDLAIALCLMFLYWESSIQLPNRRLLVTALTGAVSLWFSFPAIFIAASIGLLWSIDCFSCPTRKSLLLLASIGLLWLLSFWIHFKFLQNQTSNDYLLHFWSSKFMPITLTDLKNSNFFIELPRIFRNPLWTPHPLISTFLFCGGCIILWNQNRRLLLTVLCPLFLNLIASALHKYPFGDRLLQYAAIHLFIPIVVCLVFLLLHRARNKYLYILAVFLIIANLAEPAVNVCKSIVKPRKIEQVKQVMEKIAEHPSGDRPYYIFGTSYITFSYYIERLKTNPESMTIGPGVFMKDPLEVDTQLSKLKGDTWICFGHGKQFEGFDYEAMYLEMANTKGRLIEKIADVGAAAYLYRFPL